MKVKTGMTTTTLSAFVAAIAAMGVLLAGSAPAATKPGRSAPPPAKTSPNKSASPRSDFERASRDAGARSRPSRLPYQANPAPGPREASRTRIMAEQVRAKANRNQIRINGTGGRQMVLDVAARRPNGERHYDKATGRSARLPHVRNDRLVTDVAPDGRRFERRVRGSTREASVAELRTARRFVDAQARSRAAAARPKPGL